MECFQGSLFVLLAIAASAIAVNEVCTRAEDCPDAGTTCQDGQCRCWLEQGAAIAQIWSCSSDNACAESFPGHVCRISRGCPRASGSIGYCQIKSAAQKAGFHEKPSLTEAQPSPMMDPIVKKLNEGLEVPPVHQLIANSTSVNSTAEASTGTHPSSAETSSDHPAASTR